jgi:hypothetical protein
MPVDSIIVNPNYPQQVFAGTDIGLYYTDNINAASPVWYRFTGFPNTMIWDMQIDRGATTLSVWTRGKGAWAWPLPTGPVQVGAVQVSSIASRKTHSSAGAFDVNSSATESRSGGANGNYTMVFTLADRVNAVGNAAVTSGTGSVVSRRTGTNANEYVVELTGVANAQQLTVTLSNVQDASGNTSPTLTGTMKVLIGDTNNDNTVNSGDSLQTRDRSGQVAGSTNFRSDVNVDGVLNVGDTTAVRSRAGTSLTAGGDSERTSDAVSAQR